MLSHQRGTVVSFIMSTTVHRSAIIGLLVLSAACGNSAPTSPSGTSQPIVRSSPTPTPPTNLPPLSGSSRTFSFDRELSYPVRDYTKGSRFVLYDNGAFVLQYEGLGDYRGTYTEADGVIRFEWEGWSVAGPWGATGTVKDDLLTVRYNVIMQLDDFEDAVYSLVR
jgi:hypothetical protein